MSRLIYVVIFQFTLAIVFVTIFFFTYVRHVEEQIVNKQVDNAIQELLQEPFLINYNLAQFNLRAPDLAASDKEVEEANKHIQKRAYTFLAVTSGVCLVIFIVLSILLHLNVAEVVFTSMISIGFMAIVEILFLHCFAVNYISLDVNMIKRGIIEGLIEYAKSP